MANSEGAHEDASSSPYSPFATAVEMLQELRKLTGKGQYIVSAPTKAAVISENTMLYPSALLKIMYCKRENWTLDLPLIEAMAYLLYS